MDNPLLALNAKNIALEYIYKITNEFHINHILYVDGSLNTVTGNAGSAVLAINKSGVQWEQGARLNDWASTTQSELFAILMAMKEICNGSKDSLVVSDSQSALLSMNSHRPENVMLVSELRYRYKKIMSRGIKVKFLWIPSHIDLRMHDRVDSLAKQSSSKPDVDYYLGLTINKIKYGIRAEIINEYESERRAQHATSHSIMHYENMCKVKHVYGESNRITRLLDIVTARLRLGYKYMWQYGCYRRESDFDCKLCELVNGHTLEHYVMECNKIREYRNNEYINVHDMCNYLIVSGNLKEILLKYPKFAIP